MANKNNILNWLIALAIVIILLIVFLPSKTVEPEKFNYTNSKNYTFNFTVDSSKESNLYLLKYSYLKGVIKKDVNIPFEFSPQELESIEFPSNVRKVILSDTKGIFIVSDPRISEKIDLQDKVAQVTISRITGSKDFNLEPHIFEIDTFGANLVPVEGSEVPVLTCDNATETGRIIYLKQGTENKMYYDENNKYCVVLEFVKPKDAVKVATKLVYILLSVMP